jgi:Domain of unknown function (DUF4251)
MNRLLNYLTSILLIVIVATGCSGSKQAAASNYSKEAITEAINKNEWTFTANFAMPQTGRSRPVNGLYTVTCSGNKFVVYLPYFGRAYTAQLGSSQGPLDFQTSDFDLVKEQKKEGQWSLLLKPKDYKEVQSMNFTLYDNGSANLAVMLTNRTPISFTGNVAPKKSK